MDSDIKHLFLETDLNHLGELFSIKSSFLSNYVFRGQADKNWDLKTSLERLIYNNYPDLIDKRIIASHEREMLKEFQWKYPLFEAKSIDQDNYVEWLSVMQHYGASTRLLDFTESIFIALFMAISNSYSDSSIWAINQYVVSNDNFNDYKILQNSNSAGKAELNELALKKANDSISNSYNENQKNSLLIIRPNISNERLYRQQGLFIMPTDIENTFWGNLTPYLSSEDRLIANFKDLIDISNNNYKQEDISIIKINIARKLKTSIFKHLREMNITAESLFPGLSGLAQSLNYPRFQ